MSNQFYTIEILKHVNPTVNAYVLIKQVCSIEKAENDSFLKQ